MKGRKATEKPKEEMERKMRKERAKKEEKTMAKTKPNHTEFVMP